MIEENKIFYQIDQAAYFTGEQLHWAAAASRAAPLLTGCCSNNSKQPVLIHKVLLCYNIYAQGKKKHNV